MNSHHIFVKKLDRRAAVKVESDGSGEVFLSES